MKKIRLSRLFKTPEVTRGVFIDDYTGRILCASLELPWKDNKQDISCIPTGNYICNPYSSGKYKNVYQVMDVENRTYILIHVGNTVNDILGCILPGTKFGNLDGLKAVYSSKVALDVLKDHIGENEQFILIIE